MSRIAKAPISIPAGVDVKRDGNLITVKGSKGELQLTLVDGITFEMEDGQIQMGHDESRPQLRPLSGTSRSLVNNMIIGVSAGYERTLTIIGVGYRAKVQGKVIELQLGFSHEVKHALPEGITAETPTQTQIILKGIDKQLLGQVAADIRSYRPPEPYKGKGIRYSDEYVLRKQAKKA